MRVSSLPNSHGRVGRPGSRRRLCIQRLESRLPLASSLVISEFMASNDSALADEDGDSSDWLEVHNPTVDPINLSNWYLTDNDSDLTRWAFPDVTIAPGDYLLVWASDKDRRDPLAPLHTNFRLSAGGEYLALVEDDGTTIAHEYEPEFPEQFADVSYGLGMNVSSTLLIDAGAASRVHVPSDDRLGQSWTEIDFVDTAWQSGPTGVGYEDNPPGYDALLGNGVPPGTVTSYVRIPFEVTDAASVASLLLRVKFDDGFAAFLNGVRLDAASANAPPVLEFDSSATADHNDSEAIEFVDFDITSQRSLLVNGTNVLAFHHLNSFAGSSDMLLIPQLIASEASLFDPLEAGYFADPTPGAPNGASFQGFVADTTFSVDRGLFDAAFTLEVTTATPGAAISITLDGSVPTSTHGRITPAADPNTPPVAEVFVSGGGDGVVTVRAMAFKDGHAETNVDTQTYVFLDDVIANQTEASGTPAGFPEDGAVNGKHLDYGFAADILEHPEWGPQVRGSLEALPTLSIVTDPDNLFDAATGIYVNPGGSGRDWERPISLELIHPDGSPGFQVEAGARIRGNFSLSASNPKHAFRLFFRGEYGDSKLNYPLFGDLGAERFDKLDLRTFQNDSWAWQGSDQLTMIHDVFSRDTQRDLGQPYTRSAYYHLFLNGQYWGIYQSQERSEASYGETYFGGLEANYDTIKSAGGSQGYVTEATDGNLNGAWKDLWDLVNEIETESDPVANNALYQRAQGLDPDGTRNPALPVLLDVDNLIDYMNVIFYTNDEDAPLSRPLGNNRSNNWFAVRDREGTFGFQFFAHDAEQTMLSRHNVEGLHGDRTGPFDNGNKDSFLYSNPQWIHEDLMEGSAEYRMRFADRVFKHYEHGGGLTVDAVTARFDARAAQLDAAVIAHSARWGNGAGQDPSFDKQTWLTALNAIRDDYFSASPQTRRDIVLQQLRDDLLLPPLTAPSFNQQGGDVEAGFLLTMTATAAQGSGDFDGDFDIDLDDFAILTAPENWLQQVPAGTRGDMNHDGQVDLEDFHAFKNAMLAGSAEIYYTLDGTTDPRQIGGSVNPAPSVGQYTGAGIEINVTTTVRARAYDGVNWSPLNEATFNVPIQPIANGADDARFVNARVAFEGGFASGNVRTPPAGESRMASFFRAVAETRHTANRATSPAAERASAAGVDSREALRLAGEPGPTDAPQKRRPPPADLVDRILAGLFES